MNGKQFLDFYCHQIRLSQVNAFIEAQLIKSEAASCFISFLYKQASCSQVVCDSHSIVSARTLQTSMLRFGLFQLFLLGVSTASMPHPVGKT